MPLPLAVVLAVLAVAVVLERHRDVWFLDSSTCEALNGWCSDKTSIITGRSRKAENRNRTLDVERAIRYHRHKRVGEVLRAPHQHVDKAELLLHARIVRYGMRTVQFH